LLAWNDVQDVLREEMMPAPLNIPLDFYPLSVLLNKGIVLGKSKGIFSGAGIISSRKTS
jgi:hypothetical protein